MKKFILCLIALCITTPSHAFFWNKIDKALEKELQGKGYAGTLPNIGEKINIDLIAEKISERIAGYAGALLEKTAHIAFDVPNLILLIFAMIFSTYYFIIGYGKKSKLSVLLPKTVLAIWCYCKRLFVKYIKSYLLSTVVLLLTVFIILCIGFYVCFCGSKFECV